MIIYNEVMDGFMVAVTQENHERVIPGSVFRFCTFLNKPSFEYYQRGGSSGFSGLDGESEEMVRAFLLHIGFIEAKRKTDAGDAPLEHISKVIAPI